MKLEIIILLIFLGTLNLNAQSFKLIKTKTIKINGKNYKKIIGSVEVPENYQKLDSRKITLPIEITKSNSSQPLEPVFYLNGGPGASNILSTENFILLEKHDFVFIGYRGADGSTKLNPKYIAKAMKGLNNKLLSDESLDNIETKMVQYLSELKGKEIDPDQYSMINVIEDIEYARKALGYQKINLFGISYGTRVALLYGYKHPQSINRTVMIGANPPGRFEFDPEKTEELLGIWDTHYLASKNKSLKAAMKKSFERMPKKWSFFKLDADKIKCITFFALYEKNLSVSAFDAYFKAAEKKDYSGLYLMQLLFDKIIPKTYFGEMFAKGYSADFQSNINYRAKYRASDSATILGPNYSMLLWGITNGWTKYTISEEYRKIRPFASETLIISGDLDPSTPAKFAKEELLPILSRGQQVIYQNKSHSDIILNPGESYDKLIVNYFETGTIDSTNFINTNTINFKPRRSFNKLAKWGYPIVLLLSIFN